jgi:hypothetical protein
MIEDLGVCKGPGTVLGLFRVGSTTVSISKIGKSFYSLIDNRAILANKSEKEFVSKSIPIIALIINSLKRTAQVDALRWKPLDKNYTSLIDQTLKAIKDDPVPAKLFVLESKPDEIQDNFSPVEASGKSMDKGLEEYKFSLKKFGETIEAVNHGAGVLLRTNLEKNMWGSKKVMATLGDIKADMAVVAEESEVIENCIERSDRQASFIQSALQSKRESDQTKDIIGKAIKNFSIIKSYMSGLVQASQKLYSIDSLFKSEVGYPATWFFNGSIYNDYMLDHENLVDHLIKSASLEAKVIEPLLLWKLTGV